jgi:malonate transporter and related proteins
MSLANVIFTINVVAPVFIIVILGYFLKKIGLLTENFANIGSKLVFNISLPSLIFIKLFQVNLQNLINFKQIGFCYFGTLLFYFFAWFISKPYIKNGDHRGVFIQGCFRGNYAIIGIPLAYNLFGDPGLINASVLLISVLLINNFLAVIALTIPPCKETKISTMKIIKKIVTNPLIIAPLIAIPFSYYKINLNPIFFKTLTQLSSLAIPLALISIGATLKFENLKESIKIASFATITKIIIMPFILTIIAVKIGFRGVELASLYFLFAAPTAVASYIMADAMQCNAKLASTIVILTTTISIFTISIGVFILNFLGLF